ncbi:MULTISPECIES: extracellular solute-binding protein [unclassified Paenibacillus]|uniref:extracellular solute-binding protein n=1 Tax=unclassified Paenibacillus TaxID=185978 RepID=UPI00363B9F31
MRVQLVKKGLPITLSTMLAFTVVAGCSDNAAPPGKAPAQGTTAPKASNEVVPISMALRVYATYVEKIPSLKDDPYFKKLEELTHTKLDIKYLAKETGAYGTKLDLMFAAGDIPDVVQTSGGGYTNENGQTLVQAIEAGTFLPLNDLIDKYGPNLKKKIPEAAWEEQKFSDGKVYSLPEFLSNPSRKAAIIRKDLLDKAKLPVPKTVEEYLNVLREFKKMGLSQPFVGREKFNFSDMFLGAYDVMPTQWTLGPNGEPVPKFFNVANMEKAINTYKTMYDEGLMTKDFATQQFADYKRAIITGQGGLFTANAADVLSYDVQLKQNVPDGKLEIVPSPTGTDGKGGSTLSGTVIRGYMINKKAKNPERIIQFFDWMLSDEADNFFSYGIEGTDYTKDNGKINYKLPVTTDEAGREDWRKNDFWLLHDATYNKKLLELTPDGQAVLGKFDSVMSKEGRDGIRWKEEPKALSTTPDLQMSSIPKLLNEHMAKMIIGQEPLGWQKVVDEWKSKGGDKALKEVAETYKRGEFIKPRR